jgi:hypothetical protein
MNPKKNKLHRSLILVSLIGLLSPSALSLPKKNMNHSGLNAFQAYAVASDPVLKGAHILADDTASVFYVSPSSKKSQAGAFQQLAQPACEILEDQYDLTYMMPKVRDKDYVDFAKTGPFSPFFDAKIGNYVRYSSILNGIWQKIADIEHIKKENTDVVIAYEKAEIEFNDAQDEFNRADAAYSELQKNVANLVNSLAETRDADEIARLKEFLAEAKAIKEQEGPERKERLRQARANINKLALVYSDAKARYNTKVPTLQKLHIDANTMKSIFETVNAVAISNFSANERALQVFESSTVGIASASYSIWANEEARLQNALSSYQERNHYFAIHKAVRLPIHNVRLKKPMGNELLGRIAGDFTGNMSSSVASHGLTSDALLISDSSSHSPRPVFAKNEHPVIPEIKNLSSDGAATYTNLITRGTYCTGKSKRDSRLVSAVINPEGLRLSTEFEIPIYKHRSKNIMAQSVALEYDYFVRNDPIKVDCSLNISKFTSFLAESGESGFLFWRTSWSKTERTKIERSGITCVNNISPSGEHPDYGQQKKYVEEIQQAMMQEIAAEFVLTYAKSWQVSHNSPAIPGQGNAMHRVGSALSTLCGPNIYCQVGSIILKAADELFGYRAGTTENRDYLSSQIKRSYEENAWTVSNGQAVIELTVTL